VNSVVIVKQKAKPIYITIGNCFDLPQSQLVVS